MPAIPLIEMLLVNEFLSNDIMGATDTEILQFELFINGQLKQASGGRCFESINPSTGEVFAKVADASVNDMTDAVTAARTAFDNGSWSSLKSEERGKCLTKLAGLIRQNAKELADLESADTGKTSKQATFIDVPTSAETFEYFGNIANPLTEEKNPVTAPVDSRTLREPIGVVGCIIPWNYPLIMAAWKMAPALMAGNTIVFKPSRQASVSIMKLAQLVEQAGFPKGVVNIVPSSDHAVASALVESQDVNMISFTGGTETGRGIMKSAAANTKKLSLELGGKSPSIVFADCDMDATIGGIMSSIFMNQGQMCTAGSRLLLEESIYDSFITKLVEKTKALKIGPSASYDTDFGPVISKEHRDSIKAFVEAGKKEGAKLLCGGQIPQGGGLDKGFYFEPTIFADVTPQMTIFQEEIFGPVLTVMKFSKVEEAVKLANDTKYGLAATVWTKDLEKAKQTAQKIQAGIVWINTYGGFYNEAPFGGYKQSGFGRELGREGLLEFTQTKHICTDETPGGRPLVSSWF